MNPAAKEKIKELLDETGHVLSVDDLDDVNRLNDAVEKIAGSQNADFWPLLDRPVSVGNITLHPLTLGAHLWMVDWCQRAQDERPEMWNSVIAYALANSNNPDALKSISNSAHPWIRLFVWAWHIRASVRELERAFRKILPGYEYDPDQADYVPSEGGDSIEKTYGSMISFLTREIGATPQYWLWTESMDSIAGYIQDTADRVRRENEAAEKATSKRGHSKPQVSNTVHLALTECRAIENEIRKKWLTTE